MPKPTEDAAARMTVADLLIGARVLLLPIALAAILVVVDGAFSIGTAPVKMPPALAALPQQAWIWLLLAYLAALLPRRPLLLRVPGVPIAAKAAIWGVAGAGFALELCFHGSLAPILGATLGLMLAAGCVLAAGAMARAERLRRVDAEEARGRMLQEIILECEKMHQQMADPAATHPALFAELSGIMHSASPLGTTIWFLRPHPALGHKRPIDVLRESGGADRLVQACKVGPNI